jgi:hypothetical protein
MLVEHTQAEPYKEPSANPALARAILHTLHYADLFDFPMTLAELTRYLIECRASEADVTRELGENPALRAAIRSSDGYYYLAGREHLLAVRRERAAASAALWRRAHRYARLVQWLPFVRMVAVTGALAMDNVGQRVDIDLLIVAVPGRIWICRRFLIMAVRLARLLGDELCPNYVVDTQHLRQAQQDLYTAHELLQMVPLAGYGWYERILASNRWAQPYLPNATARPAPRTSGSASLWRRGQALAERLLRLPICTPWERGELRRMQHKLTTPRTPNAEIVFTPYQCKGHLGAYRATVLDRFTQRVMRDA